MTFDYIGHLGFKICFSKHELILEASFGTFPAKKILKNLQIIVQKIKTNFEFFFSYFV